jgi:NADH-ubiquinone oxidoreductase chain 5
LPVLFSITGAFFAFFFYTFSSKELYSLKTSSLGKKIYNFLNKKWFFDKFYNEFINQSFLNFGYQVSYKMIDRGIIEMVGPFGLSKVVYKNTSILARQHNGDVFMSLFWIFLGFSTLLILLHYWSFIVFLVGPSLIFLWVVTIAFV